MSLTDTLTADIATASVDGALLVPNSALRFTPAATTAAPSRSFVSTLMPGPPRQAARQQAEATPAGGQRRVWVLRNGQPVAVTVTVGVTDGQHTEIRDGELREGDAVITDATTGAAS
jgi:HlyD family secretion protein